MKFLTIQLFCIIVNAYLSMAVLYRGTVCGLAEAATEQPILCNGFDPRHSCPQDYTKQVFRGGVAYCYKSGTTTTAQYGLAGTICGGFARYPCGGMIPAKRCPTGYIQDFRHVCYKNISRMEDLPGTICGLVYEGLGPTCDELPKGRCPKRYHAINFEEIDYHICSKK